MVPGLDHVPLLGARVRALLPETDGLRREGNGPLREESAAHIIIAENRRSAGTITPPVRSYFQSSLRRFMGWGPAPEGAGWGFIASVPLVCSLTLDDPINLNVSQCLQLLHGTVTSCHHTSQDCFKEQSTCNGVIYQCN